MKKLFFSLIILTFLISFTAFASGTMYFDIESDIDSVRMITGGNNITYNNGALSFASVSGNSNAYYAELLMPESFAAAETFTIEFNIRVSEIKSNTRLFKMIAYDGSERSFFGINNYGQLVIKQSGTNKGITLGTTDKLIRICADRTSGKVDLYVDNTVYNDILSPDILDDSFLIKSFQIGRNARDENNNFTMSNIKIYSGSTPSDNTDSFDKAETKRYTVMDDVDGSIKAINLIGDAKIFSVNTYYNKGKYDSSIAFSYKPYLNDNILMVPYDAISELGTAADISGDNITIASYKLKIGSTAAISDIDTVTLSAAPVKIDNTVYLPLKDICSLLKLTYYADNRGYVLVGSNALSFSNSVDRTSCLENSDIVFRYITFDRPDGHITASSLKANPVRGQLLVSDDRLAKIKNSLSDTEYSALKKITTDAADKIIPLSPVEYNIPDGLRLIAACQEVRDRLITLSAAYLITDDTKYSDRIWLEISNCIDESKWQDWNTRKHFLDSGMIGMGVAIGYDTIYDTLSDEDKIYFADRIYSLYLKDAVSAYDGTWSYGGSEFRYAGSNWGAVCPGSILAMCLALVPDAEGELMYDIGYLIENSMHSLEFPMTVLAPDGSWEEGVGYTHFVSDYTTNAIDMLNNTIGDDFGFLNVPGYENIFNFVSDMHTNVGVYNFGAQSDGGVFLTSPYAYRQALMLDSNYNMTYSKKVRDINKVTSSPLDILWYDKDMCDSEIKLQNEKYYSTIGISVFRNSYENKGTPLAITKGGANIPIVSNFDKGSFIYETEGVRWAVDLGRDDYNMPGGYYGEAGYTVYRKRAEGHNCLVINPSVSDPGQLMNTSAKVYKSDFDNGKDSSYIIYDLKDVYAPWVNDYKRGFYFGDNKESLAIRDEVNLKNDSNELYWFMHTPADVVIDPDGKGAKLYLNGRIIQLGAYCSAASWHLEVAPDEPLDDSTRYTYALTGYVEGKNVPLNKITLVADNVSGNAVIDVKLSPLGENIHDNIPLDNWAAEDDYIVPPVMNITRTNGIKLHINPLYNADIAYVAEYNSGNLSNIKVINLNDTEIINLSDSIHTKVFFWDELIPEYRYYEFNTER